MYHQFSDANLFVSQVQMSDTEELRIKISAMYQAKACIATDNFPSRLRSEWMLGVYERELVARTTDHSFTPGG
jgi:hypothetical protein